MKTATRSVLSTLTWTKSSHSGATNNCLETAPGQIPGAVPVRDSKNPAGPVLLLGTDAWTTFVTGVKHSRVGL